MIWIAPSEKDTDNAALEKRLWDGLERPVPVGTSVAQEQREQAMKQTIHDFIN